MATYFAFLEFTDQRNRNINASVELAEGLKGIAEKAGIDTIGTYWTIGFHDLVIVFDAPDEEAMSIMLFGLNDLTNVRSQIVQAFSMEEMSRIIAKRRISGMSKKEIRRLVEEYFKACSKRDFDALNDIVASNVILSMITSEPRQGDLVVYIELLGHGLKTLKERLKDEWTTGSGKPIVPEDKDLAIKDSFIYVRYHVGTAQKGDVFHIVAGKIVEICVCDLDPDPESYISRFVRKWVDKDTGNISIR